MTTELAVSAQSCNIGRTGGVDVDQSGDLRLRAQHAVANLVAPPPEVRHRVQLSGGRVEVRDARAEAAAEGAVEVARADRVELVGQLVGVGARLDDRERAAGEADDVGVGREVEVAVGRARVGWLAQGRPPRRASGPSGCGTTRPAVAQPDAVHHAGAGEPVVGGGVDRADRVGAVAQVAAVEVVGQACLRPRAR